MPRTEEQFKEIREEKKRLIMGTALELFAEKGFQATPISLIAKKAGISKGLIYNYFESKEDLIKQIMIHGFKEFVEVFDSEKDGVLTDDEFDFFIQETVKILKAGGTFWKFYFAAMVQPEVMKLVQSDLMEALQGFFTILINYYKARGEKNPEAMTMLLGATLDGISLNYIYSNENYPLDAVAELIIEKFKAKPMNSD